MRYIPKWCRAQLGCNPRTTPLIAFCAALLLAGCSGPQALYRQIAGGPPPPPPPGLHQPFPNLASVPPKPAALPARTRAGVRQRLEAANAAQHALAAPPGSAARPAAASAAKPAAPRAVLVGFPRNSAIVPDAGKTALRALAERRGDRRILAGGFSGAFSGHAFGAASLRLALLRATAVANVLTDAGVPAEAIRLDALAGGAGGAAVLLENPRNRAKLEAIAAESRTPAGHPNAQQSTGSP